MPVGFERPKDARKTLGRLLSYLKNRWLLLVLVFILMLISAFSGLAGNYFLKPLINDYILPGNFSGLLNALMGLGGIYLLGVIASYLQSRIMVQVAQKTTNLMRRDLFVKMQSLPLKYFDTHTHGDLMSRFTNDLDNVQMAMEQSLVQLASSALTFVGAVIMMLVLSPLLFLVTFLVLALMFFLSGKLAGKSSKYFKAQQQNLGDVNGYVEEMVDGLKVIKVFNHEENAISEFKKRNEAYRQAASEANFYAGVVMPVMSNLNNIAYAATALFGGILTVFSSFDIGSLAAFLQYSRMVGFPVIQITNQFNTLLAAMAGAERVFNVMDQSAEVDNGDVTLVGVNKSADGSLNVNTNGERPCHWAWKVPEADGSVQYVELKGDVRFHEVNFGYEPGKTVLRQLSLYAKPGQKIALVGSTGAGKTTITNLLNRFYDVEEGSITYDGIDIKRICKNDLRQSLGMVLQDTHLFSGTILDNIRYGRLDATDEECVRAAKQVNAHSFIKRLPQGYHTQITADGTNLSQGQRQLLAITRAAIADPPVMILDEATSSIDTRTERLIEKGMDALMENRTVFVIAHRLSTVRNARAILVLENGEIIERGDHTDLLEQKGRYYQLYTGQYELS
ncbi:multidrug ABC transporter ATP-binding protein [Ornatilinea apprima]|uniref:Multidrug ABC transporter ATP-binding protein n=1 Tax=Ornatilinea apprima TaxID=1134406 RepID=A0A0P6WZC7_9CHLR|nr:multidrug ABC transporter ATP-binding protein [Ornatilinea apprima]